MQTKKKGCGRSVAQEHASPRVSRAQKKISENTHLAEKNASELITSSARKQRGVALAGNIQKKNGAPLHSKDLSRRYGWVDENSEACLGYDAAVDVSVCYKVHKEIADHFVEETIFSPTFHSSKNEEGRYTGEAESMKFYQFDREIQTANGHIVQDISQVSVEEKNSWESGLSSTNRAYTNDIEMGENYSSNNLDSDDGGMLLTVDNHSLTSQHNLEIEGTDLSSEVSAIYFAMKNSKLECVDEHGQETIAAEVCAEEDEYDEFDDFDPYFFIKNLPDLSAIVPTFRPMLLPKQTRSCPSTTLVLDLDETLVHSTLEPCDDADFTFPVNFNLQEHTVYVRCRPHLRDFMERVSSLFEIIIFTASQSIYAEQLLNVLDPKRKIFRHRVFRDSCVYVDGNYLKDLSVLGRDLARVIIIDNSPQAFGFQVDNGIPIESWFDDRSDQELLSLLPFLESLVGVEDVRPLIAKKYNLREKIAAAVYPPLNSKKGDPFER